MNIRNLIIFMAAAGISLGAAYWRWGDSGHALGLMTPNGGKVWHPVHLKDNYSRYSVIVTATVLPPYRGNAEVVLEGGENFEHSLHLSKPLINFGVTEIPKFRHDILYGLRPGHRIALWLRMKPRCEEIPANADCSLSFYDTNTKQRILKIPLIFDHSEDL